MGQQGRGCFRLIRLIRRPIRTSRLSVFAWGNECADAIVFVVFIVFLFGEGRGCRLFELFELSLILRSFSL